MSDFIDRLAASIDERANWSGSCAAGTGEYVAEEIMANRERRAEGLPERPLTWGLRPGEVSHYQYRPAITMPEASGWRMKLARWLSRDWFTAIHLEMAEEIERREAMITESTELALHDPLTGLGNRRLFDMELDAQIARSHRSMEKVAVMMIDLDWFKQVNDTYGHEGGDALLVEMAKILRRCTRAGDVIGRLGGDEFGVVLSGVNTARDAEVVASKVLEGLHELEASASIGIAVGNQSREYLSSLADRAMYAVKKVGRDGFRVSA